MHEIKLIIHSGPRAADQREQVVGLDILAGELITYCRKDYRLPEQDGSGNLVQYGLFVEHDGQWVRLDAQRSLRSLRLQSYSVLCIADVGQPWWVDHSPPSAATRQVAHAGRSLQPSDGQHPARELPSSVCAVELAPGCVHVVGERGLVVTRRFLLDALPRARIAREQARLLVGLDSALQAVSKRPEGHCTIHWARGWHLHAHRAVYLPASGEKFDHGEALLLEQTTRVTLGRQGWPLVIRLSSASLSRS